MVDQSMPDSLYAVPKTLDDGPHDTNPTFIAYGDIQAGWLAKKFVQRDTWVTWWQLLIPFYQIYLVGLGVVGGVNGLRKHPDYGGKGRRAVRDAVYQQVIVTEPDFVLNLGDICLNDGRRPDHWKTFLIENRVEVPLLDSVAYVPTIGNHEVANDTTFGFANYESVFDYPRFYVLDYRDIALIVIDSNIIIDQKQLIDDDTQDRLFREWFVSSDGDEPSWLENELAGRPERFKILAMHHPPVSVGRHHGDWTDTSHGRNLPEKRASLLALLAHENVQVVMSGHEHNYQHLVVKPGSGDVAIDVIVSSGGGAPIRKLPSKEVISSYIASYNDSGLNVELVHTDEIHHYSVVQIDESGALFVETTSVPLKDEPSSLVERVSISAGAPTGSGR